MRKHRSLVILFVPLKGDDGLNTSKNVCLFQFPKITFLNVTKHRAELEGTPWMDKNPANTEDRCSVSRHHADL